MYIRRTAIVPKYVKGGSNIFKDALNRLKRGFKKYAPTAFNFAKKEGLKLAKKHGPKILEKGGDKLLKLAMSKISNIAGGNIVPVVKPTINAGRGIKYI